MYTDSDAFSWAGEGAGEETAEVFHQQAMINNDHTLIFELLCKRQQNDDVASPLFYEEFASSFILLVFEGETRALISVEAMSSQKLELGGGGVPSNTNKGTTNQQITSRHSVK